MIYLIRLAFAGVMIGGVVVALVLVGIPWGSWVFVQLNTSHADATVIDKNVRVDDGRVRHTWLKVKYTDNGVPAAAIFDADPGTWDQCKTGSRVEVAYAPRALQTFFPTRLAKPLPPMPMGPQRSASAVIKSVVRITEHEGSVENDDDLAQPYDVVQFTFVPDGRSEAVVVLDSVDAGSMSNLAAGEPIAINYFTGRPLSATIARGTRKYKWNNSGDLGAFQIVVVGLLILLSFLVVYRLKLRRAA